MWFPGSPVEPSEIREMCLKSADDMLAYSELFGANESVVKARGYLINDRGVVIIQLESALTDPSDVSLRVGEDIFGPGCMEVAFLDPGSKTIGIRFTQGNLDAIFEGHPDVEVVSDLSFLIRQTRDYFERYGEVGFPCKEIAIESSDIRFPAGMTPTDGQRKAVDTILRSGFSYVWGAPGTGKTQMVLVTALMAYVRSRRRVAVIAPTNNAVEQVIRGLAAAISSDPAFSRIIDIRKDIARLGIPSKGFLRDFPGMCEHRASESAKADDRRRRDLLSEILDCRRMERARGYILECMGRLEEFDPDAASVCAEMAIRVLEGPSPFSCLCHALRTLNTGEISRAYREYCSSDHPVMDIGYYDSYSDEEIEAMMAECGSVPEGSADPLEALIVACTPQTYMSRFRPNGSEGDKPEFAVEHIFFDEAGYSNCLMSLALLANGVPMTLLGDHKQLPPVCTVDDQELRAYIKRGGFMQYGFLWSQSALFTESIIRGSPRDIKNAFLALDDPLLEYTGRADLVESHRFGGNLAEILDRYVYRNGIRGRGGTPLEIVVIDAKCPPREKRVNRPEAEAIGAFLESGDPGEFCILSPYRTQVDTIRKVLPEYDESIMTVHKSQGREWDTVILSVQDGEGCVREVPLRFTSSEGEPGIKVVNTAVSRAKKRLVVVCDYDFWHVRTDELIGGLVSEDSRSRLLRWDGSVLAECDRIIQNS